MELERLVAALAPEAVLGSPDPVEVRDLAYDTRAVTPGAAFFCVPGEHADGHDFAVEAVENGAAVLVVEHAVEPKVPQLVVPSSRAAMATATPSRAKCCATASPMPDDAPVIAATRPERSISG